MIPNYAVRVLCLSLLWSLPAQAATARDGFAPELALAAAAPRYANTDRAALAIATRAMQSRRNAQPLRFAVGAPALLDLGDGHWDIAGDGEAVWRMRLASPGAKLLSLSFARFHLPPSARLYFYDLAATQIQGPYTAADENPDGVLSTAVVPGDEAVLELRVTAAERGQVQLKLERIYHGFREFPGAASAANGVAPKLSPGSSASCEVNVACPEDDAWRKDIRSEALVQIGNSFLCSGQLLNDVPGDDTPYLITAHHCQIGASAETAASKVVVYWNYQSSTCAGGTGDTTRSQSGSTMLATDAQSDFTLVRLNAQPAAAFDVYYAGWDVNATRVPSSGVGIHQPEGDIKKISTYSMPLGRQQIQLQEGGANQTVDAWAVSWSSGITEEGSSGSGIWNQDHRVVGVLSGGDTSSDSCSSAPPRGPDFYGRFDVAWAASSSSSGQLKAWLNPHNAATDCLDGRDPGDPPAGCSASGFGGGSTTGSTTTGGGGGGGGAGSALLWLAPLLALKSRRASRKFR